MLYSKELDQGIDKDVALEMLKRSGCKFTITTLPRARIWLYIEQGSLDFSMSGITNKERDQFADFGWYLFNKYYFLVRKDSGVKNLSDFKNNKKLLLGKIRSFRYCENGNALVDQMEAQKRIFEVTQQDQLLDMIKRNHIQGIIVEPFNYSQIESKELEKITKIIDLGGSAVLHGLIMSKKSLSEAERKKWKELIAEMHRDGTILKILSKYFKPKLANSMIDF